MYITLVSLALIGMVSSAPFEDNKYYQNVRRTKNSLDLFNKKCHESSLPLIPVALSLQPQASPSQYASPQYAYRENDGQPGKHIDDPKQARSLYEPSVAASAASYGPVASAGIAGISSGAPASAYGVFPQAQVSPCAKPLLLSCSPTVTAGHLLEQHYSAPSYKEAEDQMNHLHHHHHNHQENEVKAKSSEMKSW